MKKYYLLLLILSLMYYTNTAQTIQGTIIDNNTNEALIGVNIILENGQGTSTDIFGKYTLKTQSGSQKIIFKYIGYEEITKEISLSNGETKIINLSLKNASKQFWQNFFCNFKDSC